MLLLCSATSTVASNSLTLYHSLEKASPDGVIVSVPSWQLRSVHAALESGLLDRDGYAAVFVEAKDAVRGVAQEEKVEESGFDCCIIRNQCAMGLRNAAC